MEMMVSVNGKENWKMKHQIEKQIQITKQCLILLQIINPLVKFSTTTSTKTAPIDKTCTTGERDKANFRSFPQLDQSHSSAT